MKPTSLLFATFSTVLLSATSASPAPREWDAPRSLELTLLRRARPQKRSGHELKAWASSVRTAAHGKYGKPLPPSLDSKRMRRANGPVQLFDVNQDSEYVGTISVGTPPVSRLVIMDTGSADLWLASSECTTGCSGVPTYDPSSSSSSETSSTSFQVQYGSGAAQGTLVRDQVSLGGLSNSQQVLGVAEQVSTNLLSGDLAGLLGLGFQAIASSGAKPLVQALFEDGQMDTPVMQFALTRFIDNNNAATYEPGGILNVGAINSSLYTGNINYVDLVQSSYWLIELGDISVGGTSAGLSGSSYSAAIDTGTSLIGGPPAAIEAVYAAIPGAAASTDPQLQGYWEFPCDSSPDVAFEFGGVSYSIDVDDFNLGQVSQGSSMCVGALFELQETQGTPPFIVGASFLKNVVSFFSFKNPLAVGFATPSSSALKALENDEEALKGLASVTAGASGASSTGDSTGAAGRARISALAVALALGAVIGLCA